MEKFHSFLWLIFLKIYFKKQGLITIHVFCILLLTAPSVDTQSTEQGASGKRRPAWRESQRRHCSLGGDLGTRRPSRGTWAPCSPPRGAAHVPPPLPRGGEGPRPAAQPGQPQTRRESENKRWLASEFLFPVTQMPYRPLGHVCSGVTWAAFDFLKE